MESEPALIAASTITNLEQVTDFTELIPNYYYFVKRPVGHLKYMVIKFSNMEETPIGNRPSGKMCWKYITPVVNGERQPEWVGVNPEQNIILETSDKIYIPVVAKTNGGKRKTRKQKRKSKSKKTRSHNKK